MQGLISTVSNKILKSKKLNIYKEHDIAYVIVMYFRYIDLGLPSQALHGPSYF